MIFKTDKAEIELSYVIGAYIRLKKALQSKNLRTTLLLAAKKEEYEVFAKAVKEFSGGKISKTEDAYPLIDAYVRENATTYYDAFFLLIEEIGEAGFFGERKTVEELKALAASPELEIDLDEITSEAMKLIKNEAFKQTLLETSDTTLTGATISTTSDRSLTVMG